MYRDLGAHSELIIGAVRAWRPPHDALQCWHGRWSHAGRMLVHLQLAPCCRAACTMTAERLAEVNRVDDDTLGLEYDVL